MLSNIPPNKRKVGIKECLKIVENNQAKIVYIAKDVEPNLISKLISSCQNKNVSVEYVDTMKQLGKMCGISVNAASAVIINN